MAKKKEPEKAANHERWLVSYADFITLLFAFFVVMFATSQTDQKKVVQFQEAFNSAMAGLSMWPSDAGAAAAFPGAPASPGPVINISIDSSTGVGVGLTPGTTPESADPDKPDDAFLNPPPAPDGPDQLSATDNPELPQPPATPTPAGPEVQKPFSGVGPSGSPQMEEIFQDLKEMLKNDLLNGKIDVKEEKRGIVISLGEAGFFDSGDAGLQRRSLDTVDAIGAKLRDLVSKRNIVIRTEGHTDNEPLGFTQGGRYRDNLELSTARANSVVRRFLSKHGFQPRNVVAAGYGEYRPVASNATPEGRARNRRVDIVLLSDELASMEPSAEPPAP